MKIGFSFGRCVRDIVNGQVQYDDVMFIISATCMEGPEHVNQVIESYLHRRDYLEGLDPDQCLAQAHQLWQDQKILQPRLQGINRNIVPKSVVWADLYAPPARNTEAVAQAWNQYRMLVALTN